MLKVQRILVPVDFSKESDLALDWALVIAQKNVGATIYLLHVLPPKASGMGSMGYRMEKDEIEKKLAALQNQIPKSLHSSIVKESGKVPQVVSKFCEEKDIDLVIMTTRGRRGMKHFLTDSITEESIRLAPCPVLVLHLNSKNKPAPLEP